MDVCGRLNARLAAAELAATAKLGVAAKLAAGAIVKAASVHGFAGAVSLGVGAESAKAGGKPPTNRGLNVTPEGKFILYLRLTPLCRE